jgi:hypothetical protein
MQFQGGKVNPMTGLRVAGRQIELLDGLDGGVERRGIVAIRVADVISAKQRNLHKSTKAVTDKGIETESTERPEVAEMVMTNGVGCGKVISKAD